MSNHSSLPHAILDADIAAITNNELPEPLPFICDNDDKTFFRNINDAVKAKNYYNH